MALRKPIHHPPTWSAGLESQAASQKLLEIIIIPATERWDGCATLRNRRARGAPFKASGRPVLPYSATNCRTPDRDTGERLREKKQTPPALQNNPEACGRCKVCRDSHYDTYTKVPIGVTQILCFDDK